MLAEPIIPETLYTQVCCLLWLFCHLLLLHADTVNGQAIDCAKDKNSLPTMIMAVYTQLDPLNRRVIDRLGVPLVALIVSSD